MAQKSLAVAIANELPDDAPPLYKSIDPEALNDLFADHSTSGRVEFQHDTHSITVDSSGTIEVANR